MKLLLNCVHGSTMILQRQRQIVDSENKRLRPLDFLKHKRSAKNIRMEQQLLLVYRNIH